MPLVARALAGRGRGWRLCGPGRLRYLSAMSEHEDDEPTATPDPDAPDAKKELFEAIDHFKQAASLFFDKASKSSAVTKTVSAIESASEKADGWTEKIDPAFESASKEAERVIGKLGATAEPLAKQLTGELKSLTKRFGDVARGGTKRRPPPSEPPKEPEDPQG